MKLVLEHFLPSQEDMSRSFLEFSFFVTKFSVPRFFSVEILQQVKCLLLYYDKGFFQKLI